MSRMIDLTGLRFGRLTALCRSDKKVKKGVVFWECKCDCGNITVVSRTDLVRGSTKSCGCLKSEWAKEMGLTFRGGGCVSRIFYEFDGEQLSIGELSERTGISRPTIYYWHEKGEDVIGNIRKRIGE